MVRASARTRTRIKPEALDLFDELEHRHDLQSQDHRDKEHQLARLLDLVPEYWTVNSVLDRRAEPVHGPGYTAHHDFHRCREVRNQLLAALEAQRTR